MTDHEKLIKQILILALRERNEAILDVLRKAGVSTRLPMEARHAAVYREGAVVPVCTCNNPEQARAVAEALNRAQF